MYVNSSLRQLAQLRTRDVKPFNLTAFVALIVTPMIKDAEEVIFQLATNTFNLLVD